MHRRLLGLAGRWKLLLLAIITAVVGIVVYDADFKTSVYLLVNLDVPFVGVVRPALHHHRGPQTA